MRLLLQFKCVCSYTPPFSDTDLGNPFHFIKIQSICTQHTYYIILSRIIVVASNRANIYFPSKSNNVEARMI